MEKPDDKYYCDDDEGLAKMLHEFFVVEGHDEVVIQHPTDGERIITKAEYEKLQENIKRAKNMNPAERMVESKRIKNKLQQEFKKAMTEAKSYVIDLDDEESFGLDINGAKIDIEGMDFVPIDQYIKGIEVKEFEIGCFASESMHKPPVRLLTKDKVEPAIH